MKFLHDYKAGKKACVLIKRKAQRVKVEEVVFQGLTATGNAVFDPLLEGEQIVIIKNENSKEFQSGKEYDIIGMKDHEAVIFLTEDCFKKYCMKVIGV